MTDARAGLWLCPCVGLLSNPRIRGTKILDRSKGEASAPRRPVKFKVAGRAAPQRDREERVSATEVISVVGGYLLMALAVYIVTLARLTREEYRRNKRCTNKEIVATSHGLIWPLTLAISLIPMVNAFAYKLGSIRVEKLPEVREHRKAEHLREIERLEQETKEEDHDGEVQP